MDLSDFTQGRTRETAIRRDSRGQWFNGADPISHPNLVQNFNAWIDRAEDGRFCLSNAINWAYVSIEGPPFWVRSVELLKSGDFALSLSGGLQEEIDASKIYLDSEASLWCAVKNGRCPARFDNHAALQIEPYLVDAKEGALLRVQGRDHKLAVEKNPLEVGAKR